MLTLLKALADPLRLRLLDVLAHGELTVQDLTMLLELGQSKVSHHLKILCAAGVLAVKPQGTWNYYRLVEENELFQEIWPQLRSRLDTLPEHRRDLAALTRLREQRRRESLAFFDQHARDWDDLAQSVLPTPDYLAELLARVPAELAVAELGIGTGGLLPHLADRCRRLIGIDHSAAMLQEAGRRLAASGQECELRLGELAHLPLADAEVDLVLMNMVLHHIPQPQDVLREVRRVLTGAGRVVIADLQRHQHDAVRATMADVWLGFEEVELEAWLTDAGFVVESMARMEAVSDEYGVLLVVARVR